MPQVEGYIQRKSMLYKTGVEYGDYTLNFVQGCAHGCRYPCYAFLMKKRFGQVKTYEDWLKPYLVSNTLEILDKEIPRLKGRINHVQLCFTTDSFMYGYDDVRDAIDAIVGGALTNFAHRADLFGYVPINRSVNGHALQADIALSAADVGAIPAAGVAPAPYPARLGEDPSIYIVFDSDVHNLSYSGSGILSVLGCYVPLGPARHLVLGGFDSVSWPSDLHVIADHYVPEFENYYEVGNANGQNYIRFLFAD
jgi:hypothetical protein